MTAKRILIVEDEKSIRDMVAFGLRRAGYDVREAEDCREARARIVDVRPDLMLVDWMLPDMSGLELTRSLKRAKDTEEIPVIMLTARAEEQDKVGGLEGGADDYITKPFAPRGSGRRGGHRGGRGTEARRLEPPGERRRARNRVGAHGIPFAAFFHDASGAGVHPRPVARPRMGRQYLCGRAYGGCTHSAVAQGARTVSTGPVGSDGARLRLPLFRARHLTGDNLRLMASMWTFALARLAGILIAGLVVGLLVGPIWAWLLAAACLYLGWQLLNLHRLDRWLRLRSQLDPPNLGGIWGDIIGQVVRLHRRKQFHKQRLVQLYRELRRSTAALPDGVIILSSQKEIVWFNRQAARLLGLKRPVDVGLRVDNLIRSPEFVRYLHSDDFSVPIIIRPPVHADLFLALQLVPYGAGQFLLLVRDVTRQMRLEATRKDFVANASTELRTPLTVIAGYLDTLADDPSIDEAWAGPIKDMRAQAQRMNTIISDLLVLSRLESTDGEAPRDPIDVPGMLERLHRDALASADRPRQIVLELVSSDGLFGSAHELESAFTNLLVNGMKYTLADGTGRMRWWVDADGAYFSVIDSGIGIPAEHLPRLTERFYRVDAGRSRGEGGSGLGLAIVKHAVQRH